MSRRRKRAKGEDPQPLDLFSYPNRPGYKREGTSKGAAKDMVPVAPVLRDQVLDALLKHGSMTADETADVLKKSILSIRPRFSELRTLGLVEDTGLRRENESGKPANIWRVTAKCFT